MEEFVSSGQFALNLRAFLAFSEHINEIFPASFLPLSYLFKHLLYLLLLLLFNHVIKSNYGDMQYDLPVSTEAGKIASKSPGLGRCFGNCIRFRC